MKQLYKMLCGLLLALQGSICMGQSVDPAQFSFLRWRNIGPFRGGRTVGACGHVKQPNVFYIGVNNGGVWKTDDYGRTWNPIFDDQPTGSIGDVAVAPSDPNVIYVGSGEGLQRPDLSVGNGMYRSADGGKTWQHLGLEKGMQIAGIAIDPRDANKVFAAVLGSPYGPNKERGLYRTADGGKTWQQVLYKDENTGAAQVTIDPTDPNIVYADLWAGRLAPWENGIWNGPGSGLYKSTDGGTTWKQLQGGLPGIAEGLERIGFCIAPSDHNRLYAVVNAGAQHGGIYRSDDGGANWKRMNNDQRLWDRGNDFAEIKADPRNKDIVYDANVVTWRSADGGATWKAFKGAPGGDDYHRLWINPERPEVMLLASDQGAGVTVNGGATWSSWYNQPTAQLYHVSADNDYPYNVYGGQQESGSVGVATRGNYGAVTMRDWRPVGADEYAYVTADPLDPNIVYGGRVTRHDKRTGQTQDISPTLQPGRFRVLRTAPLVFSPVDNRTLYYAGNIMLKTRDGGGSWQEISPDLTRTSYDIAESIGIYITDTLKTMRRRGVIYTIAPSYLDSNILWAGTDDGLIHITKNGGSSWTDVTPPGLTAWSKVSLMDASHFDKYTAYAAVNRIRLNDMRPHIYRTRDGGTSWQEIVAGLPEDPINVVREDPVRRGLLYAGSERAVYVSFDDGEHWQSLRMNMPATSIRDLVVKDDDIAVATHGRGFWIMDNITTLRQAAAYQPQSAVLYKPQLATRVRWNMYPDTPPPPDEPAGENPPDGAMIEYYLKSSATSVTLELLDNSGKVIRRFTSADTPYAIPRVNIPTEWIRPQQMLQAKAGAHRFVWDMHYAPLPGEPHYPISAVYHNTAPAPTSPWVMPGMYSVRLTVDGKVQTTQLEIRMDPRVKMIRGELQQQHDISLECYNNILKAGGAVKQLERIQAQLPAADALRQEAAEFTAAFGRASGMMRRLMHNLQEADVPVTQQRVGDAKTAMLTYLQTWDKWQDLRKRLLVRNEKLRGEGKEGVTLE